MFGNLLDTDFKSKSNQGGHAMARTRGTWRSTEMIDAKPDTI